MNDIEPTKEDYLFVKHILEDVFCQSTNEMQLWAVARKLRASIGSSRQPEKDANNG